MKVIVIILINASLLLLAAGCDEFKKQEEFLEIKVRPEQVKTIDTMTLEQKADVNEVIEINRPSEKEMTLSIEQCRAMTLINNLDLKVQLIEPTIAGAQLGAEEAKFESSFFANAAYNNIHQPGVVIVDQATEYQEQMIDGGVNIPLQTGGTVKFDLADDKIQTVNTNIEPVVVFPGGINKTITEREKNTQYNAVATFSISQPLLRGAGKRANTHSIRILEYQRQIANAQTKLEVIRVIANADRGYWRLYAARKELEVRQQEYELARAQLEQTRRMVLLGEKAAVEETRSEAGVAERLDAIIKSKKALQDRERELKQIMNDRGLGIDSPTILVPQTEPDPVRYQIDSKRLTESAIENRMEMLQVELQIAQDASSVDFYKNQALPLLALDYTYNLNGLGPARSDAYDMLTDRSFENHQVGLQLLVPLGNEAAKNRVLEAQYRKSQRLFSKENRKIAIETEVLGAIDQLEANWQSILAGRQNSILAGKLYEAEKRQFVAGLRTATDVLDAQAKFANAQSMEIAALTEYQISQVDLAYATGTLLGAAKVQWEPIVPSRETK